MVYEVDPLKQSIANSWPDQMDDSAAREEWGWMPQYDLDSMTKDMLEKLSETTEVIKSRHLSSLSPCVDVATTTHSNVTQIKLSAIYLIKDTHLP